MYLSSFTKAKKFDWFLNMKALVLADMRDSTLQTSWIAEIVDNRTNQNHSRI